MSVSECSLRSFIHVGSTCTYIESSFPRHGQKSFRGGVDGSDDEAVFAIYLWYVRKYVYVGGDAKISRQKTRG